MTDRTVNRSIWWAAILCLLAGVWLSLRSAFVLRDAAASLREKRADFLRLQVLAGELARHEAARSAYEDTPASAGRQPLKPVLAELASRVKMEDMHEFTRALPDGWVLRQKEIVLRDVPFVEAMSLVERAERLRPPWRMAKCVLRASARRGGTGQVILLLETVDRG